MQQESTSWYKQEWCIVLSLLFLFPLGLFLMWKFSKWPSLVRTIITVVIVVIALASITYIGQVQMIKPYVANLDSSSESDKSDSITDKDEENHEKQKNKQMVIIKNGLTRLQKEHLIVQLQALVLA